MADAILRVLRAGPLTTVQDGGRPGFARYGVTEGGPMDRTAHLIGQHLAGNPADGAGLEVDSQGLSLLCLAGAVGFAFTGGDFALRLDGQQTTGWQIGELREGQRLDISMNRWGNWCYLAFAGEIDSTQWLGSRSVNPSWAVSGSRLRAEDQIAVRHARPLEGTPRRLPTPVFARPATTIHVVPGPQERFFAQESFARFYGESFAVSSQYNRQGIRLDGPPLTISPALYLGSDRIRGREGQVEGRGQASGLRGNLQTTGGYPKIGTIITADQDGLAQLRPRQRFRFTATTAEDGIGRLRRRHARIRDYLDAVRR